MIFNPQLDNGNKQDKSKETSMGETAVKKLHLNLPNYFLSKKVFRNSLLILLCGMILTMIQPLRRYLHSTNTLKELKQSMDSVLSYDIALYESLPKIISTRAAEINCHGIVILDDKIGGNDNVYPQTLENDIRLALLSYDKWKLLVDEETHEEITKRFDKFLGEWPEGFSGSELTRIAEIGKKRVNPDYEVRVTWDRVSTEEIRDIKLIVTILKPVAHEQIISEVIQLTHPETERKLKNQIAEETKQIARLDQQARVSRYIFFILLGIAVLLSLSQGYSLRRRQWLTTQHKQYLLDNIHKRTDFVTRGNFVAAMELVDEYLKYFPNDIDVIAFRQAILDYTNNNPQQVQLNLVEAKKLQSRIESSVDQKKYLLENSSKESGLKNHPMDNDDWHSHLTRASTAVEELQSTKELNEQLERVTTLLKHGRITAAEKIVDDLKITTNPPKLLEELRTTLENLRKESQRQLENVQYLLQSGKLREARRELSLHLEKFSDHTTALELEATLDRAASVKANVFKLVATAGGKDCFLFCKEMITIGREDASNKPDITFSDRHISREHARVIVKTDQVFIQDLNSTNGIFIDGMPVQKETLNTDAILTLAKVVNLEVSVQKRNGLITGLLLSNTKADYVVIISDLTLGIKDNDLILTGDYVLNWDGEILVLNGPNTSLVFEDGSDLQLENNYYNLEVLS